MSLGNLTEMLAMKGVKLTGVTISEAIEVTLGWGEVENTVIMVEIGWL